MPTKKEQTRARILDAAGKGFRSQGYAGIGVDGIAKAAGVTSGAFYAHFGSKDGAFDAALAQGLDEVIASIPTFRQEHGRNWTQAFGDYYLGRPHRRDLECGCAMTTLSPEVVRGEPQIQSAYRQRMDRIIQLMADGLEGGDEGARSARAWAMLSALIGGLTLSRAVGDDKTAETIAMAAKTTALAAAGEAKGL